MLTTGVQYYNRIFCKLIFNNCRTYFPWGEMSPRNGRKSIGLLCRAQSLISSRDFFCKKTWNTWLINSRATKGERLNKKLCSNHESCWKTRKSALTNIQLYKDPAVAVPPKTRRSIKLMLLLIKLLSFLQKSTQKHFNPSSEGCIGATCTGSTPTKLAYRDL